MRKYTYVAVCLYVVSVLFAFDAHAYLDPGTGGYLIQLVIGFIAGGLFLLKVFWQRVKFFLNKLVRRKVQTDDSGKGAQLAEKDEL